MTDADARRLVLEALRTVAAPVAQDERLAESFIAGARVPLDELELDSLASMELCIALERSGLALEPEQLPALGSLAAIAAKLQRAR